MARPNFLVNIRQIRAVHRQQARRFLAELSRSPSELIEDLNAKADYVMRVAFGGGGVAAMDRVRAQIAENHAQRLWMPANLAATAYAGEFADHLRLARRIYKSDPDEPVAARALFRALMLNGDAVEAMDFIRNYLSGGEAVHGLDNPVASFLGMLVSAGHREWVEAAFPGFAATSIFARRARAFAPPPSPPIPAYCINMDRDSARLRRTQVLMAGGVDLRRVQGVSGASLPDGLLQKTGLEIAVPRRAQVGCHMGHMNAWERIAREVPDGEYGLVVEDDALFLHGPGAGLSEALALARSHGLEILFTQIEPTIHLAPVVDVADLSVLTVDEVIRSAGGATFTGWGGEGYLLTPAGARRLIDIEMEIGVLGPLDWQIALCSAVELTEDMTAPRYGVIPQRLLARRAREPERFHLRGGALNIPLVSQSDLGYKAHNFEVSLGA